MDDGLEISLVNDLREVARTAGRIDAFCSARGLRPEVAFATNLVIDELLTNTISHGYDDDDPHRIEVIVRAEGEILIVVIVDDGRAFDPSQSQVRDVDLDAALDDRTLGGLGFLLVQEMMDGVEYQRLDGCNVVTLTKNTTDPSSHPPSGTATPPSPVESR